MCPGNCDLSPMLLRKVNIGVPKAVCQFKILLNPRKQIQCSTYALIKLICAHLVFVEGTCHQALSD